MALSSRARQALTILDQVLEGPADRRTEMLSQICGEDSTLRRQVESLLASEEQAEAFLDTPLLDSPRGHNA